MKRVHEFSQLLVAAWRLSGEDLRMPTSHQGILDRALNSVQEQGTLPSWVRLNFADSRIGLKCVELDSILRWAQDLELTSDPNPSYLASQIRISDTAARKLLKAIGVSEEEAAHLGASLRQAVEKARQELAVA